MQVRVPLLLCLVDAVIERRDPEGTRDLDPPGPAQSGMDDIFREPVVYDNASGAQVAGREVATQYHAPVRVQCQVETTLYDNLNMAASGNLPDSRMTLVAHRQQLAQLNLIDSVTGNILIRVGDRVRSLERSGQGVTVTTFPNGGLFITEVRPASWGFGPDGHDLHLLILEPRDPGTT
jgi:hypothetical protein